MAQHEAARSPCFVRAATAIDQDAIVARVREARLNPLGLHWSNFLLAEEIAPLGQGETGRVVGVGQVKPHGDGSRELASIVVHADRRRDGIATALIRELLRREPGTIYLYCRTELTGFYTRFGFAEIPGAALPPSLRRAFRLGRLLTTLFAPLVGEQVRLVAMRRPPTGFSG